MLIFYFFVFSKKRNAVYLSNKVPPFLEWQPSGPTKGSSFTSHIRTRVGSVFVRKKWLPEMKDEVCNTPAGHKSRNWSLSNRIMITKIMRLQGLKRIANIRLLPVLVITLHKWNRLTQVISMVWFVWIFLDSPIPFIWVKYWYVIPFMKWCD